MCKECRERFASTQSGKCTTCGKHIQMNLGKHVALYHMELAQLWRCPVSWCTVWKGTAHDCVDHMSRAHDIPALVKPQSDIPGLAPDHKLDQPRTSLPDSTGQPRTAPYDFVIFCCFWPCSHISTDEPRCTHGLPARITPNNPGYSRTTPGVDTD